jgi:hypothetical protein
VTEAASLHLERPRSALIQAIGRLEGSDWTILFTVLMAICAMGVLGVLGLRLAALGPSGAASQPAATPIALPAAIPLPVAAPAAPATPGVAPTPSAQAMSTVDTGSPAAGARLRAEPRLEAAILERLAHGSQVSEIGPQAAGGGRTWRQIRSPSGTVGWMDASLLRRSAAPPASR